MEPVPASNLTLGPWVQKYFLFYVSTVQNTLAFSMLACSGKAEGNWKTAMAEAIRDWCLAWSGWGIFFPKQNISPEDTEALKWWLVCSPWFAFLGLGSKTGIAIVNRFPASTCIDLGAKFLVSIPTLPPENPGSKIKSDPVEVSLYSAQATTSTHSLHIRSEPHFSRSL